MTLSRSLFQHVTPVSEVLQNPGHGFLQRERRVDEVRPVAHVGVPDKEGHVEMTATADKRKATHLERTASPARTGARTVSNIHMRHGALAKMSGGTVRFPAHECRRRW